MYEYLQHVLNFADAIGETLSINMGGHFGDTILVSGKTPDGVEFRLRLDIEREEATNE